ncbi:MAG: D-Ala-D-Ala carboxypeptidase family metallohydrolase [Pseudomonadota bacterium]
MLFQTPPLAAKALTSVWRWPHFTIQELACQCSGRFCRGEYWHDGTFLDALEKMRSLAGRALIVTSGHRCPQWNAAVGGAPRSQHKTIAADILLADHNRHRLKEAAMQAGFSGLGLARSFLHIDRRAVPARWYYNGSESLWKTS